MCAIRNPSEVPILVEMNQQKNNNIITVNRSQNLILFDILTIVNQPKKNKYSVDIEYKVEANMKAVINLFSNS